MLFNSWEFLIVLLVTVPLYYLPLGGLRRRVWQVLLLLAASAVFGGLLWYAAGYWDWTGLQAQAWMRAGLMLGVTSGGVVVYFAILKGLGVDLRALWRR